MSVEENKAIVKRALEMEGMPKSDIDIEKTIL